MELDLPTASPWRRYELCAASYSLSQKARELGQAAYQDTEEAQSGLRIHGALAGKEVALSQEEQTSVNFLRERAQEQIMRIFGDGGGGEGKVKYLIEERLYFDPKILSGQPDWVIYNEHTALVQDFKTGFHEPDSAQVNAQLRVLAVLVGLRFPAVEEVIVQIVSGPYGVTEARYGMAELAVAYEDILATWRRITAPNPVPTPSPEACRYCPATLICPVPAAARQPLAKLVELPPPAQAESLLNTCELLSRQIEQIRNYYKGLLEDDPRQSIPGWILVPGPARREVTDWKAAKAKLEEFIEAEAIEALANYSIPQLEKLLQRELKLGPRAAGAKLAEILGEHLTVRSGNLVLKPDKRKLFT